MPSPTITTLSPELALAVRDLVHQIMGTTPGAKAVPVAPLATKQEVLVKLTATAAGDEKYKGKLMGAGTVEIASTGGLTDADLGKEADYENVLFLNAKGAGKAGHSLSVTGPESYVTGIVVGYNTETPPLLVVKAAPGGGSLPAPDEKYHPLQAIDDNLVPGYYALRVSQ